ncbi:unnamed protein product [Rhodiola kirilowii]
MEQNVGQGSREPLRSNEPVRGNTMETKHDGHGSANQKYFHDPSTSISTNIRPPDFNTVVTTRPVNYSIQTGEEFALEFMRERVNPRQQFNPNSYVVPSSSVSYANLLGVSHAGFESGSGVLTAQQIDEVRESESKSLPVSVDTAYFEAASLPPQESSRNISYRGPQSYPSVGVPPGSSSGMVKFLCSFGGKVMPRPRDGKLRYVGGDTHIIRISKDISYQELMNKTSTIYAQPHTIKYQLPGEDLDALVSVSSDEDLQNMMEEYNLLETGDSQKLRMFLISNTDVDDNQYSLGSTDVNSEFQYIVSVNGMDYGSKSGSFALDRSSANNLDELISLNVEKHSRSMTESDVPHPDPSTYSIPLPVQSHQQILPRPTSSFHHGSQAYQNQNMFRGPYVEYASSPFHPITNLQDPAPMTFQYSYGSHVNSRGNPDGLPVHGYPVRQDTGVNFREPQPKIDSSGGRLNDSEKLRSYEKETLRRRDSSAQKMDETENMSSFDNQPVTSHGDGGVTPREELSNNTTSGIRNEPVLDANTSKRQEETAPRILEPGKIDKRKSKDIEDGQYSSIGASNPGYVESEASQHEYNYHDELNAQRVYHSERMPREQAGLNRLSKSDDSFGSQFLMVHAHSDTSLPATETVDRSHGRHAPSLAKSSASSTVPGSSQLPKDDGRSELRPQKDYTEGTSIPDKQRTYFPEESVLSPSNHILNATVQSGTRNSDKKNGNDPIEPANNPSSKNIPEAKFSNADVNTPEPGDIVIDINDRFPSDFLSDIFYQARMSEDVSRFKPLHNDGPGISMNIENPEPKHWSYFQKLAQDDNIRKDVSLMDQDHVGFSSVLVNANDGAPVDYSFPPLKNDGSPLDGMGFTEDSVQEPSHVVGHTTTGMENDPSNTKQVPQPAAEEGKLELRNTAPPDLQIIKNEDLEELKELGSGTFGTVYHGKWRGTDVAIKRIKKSCFTGRSSEQERLTLEFWREAEILSSLHHPNVVAFYGVVQDGPGGTLATVTEYMVNGSLRHVLLSKDRHLDRRKRLIIAMDAAFGMEYLHSKNIVHFDLKCDNLLVNLKDISRPICKVGDFGLSKIKRNTLVTGGVRGTLPWMAPELLNGSSSKVSEKVDVFSFGIVLWEILTGEEPYANMHYGAIIGGIVNNTLRPHVPSFCDNEWRELMEHCWAPDPIVRPSFTEIASRLRAMTSHAKPHGPK